MNGSTITVHWHNDNQPIYSVDFQPPQSQPTLKRLVTGGGDNNIRIWQLHITDNVPTIEYVSTLRKHTQAVNVVRFNSKGDLLATASDDGTLMLWRRSPTIIKELDDDNDDDPLESWQVVCQIRSSTSEINDICWSADDKYIVTGSMDNILRIYKLAYNDKITPTLIASATDHSHYIQGVYWDPLNQYIVSQSADRSVNVYTLVKDGLRLHSKLCKFNNQYLYYSETLQSFFRRLCFSPDGALLLTPAGMDEQETPLVYVFTRNNLSTPSFKITGINKPAIAIAFNPIKYKCDAALFKLPYKYVFAIATKDSVVIYSTEKLQPIGFVSNLHYSTITDLRWDYDGSKIIISSADGFCSVITVEKHLLGEEYTETTPTVVANGAATEDVEMEDVIKEEPKEVVKEISQHTPDNNDTLESKDTSTEAKVVVKEAEIEDKSTSPKHATIDAFFTPKTKKTKKRITPTLVQQ